MKTFLDWRCPLGKSSGRVEIDPALSTSQEIVKVSVAHAAHCEDKDCTATWVRYTRVEEK